MSVDQMLWHGNTTLQLHLGEITAPRERNPLPRSVMKFLVLNLPWPRGAPTLATLVAKQQYDFAHERQRCLQLIDKFISKDLMTSGPRLPFLEKSQARTSAGFKPNIRITISGNVACDESNAGG